MNCLVITLAIFSLRYATNRIQIMVCQVSSQWDNTYICRLLQITNFSRSPKVPPLRPALQFVIVAYLLLWKNGSLVKSAPITPRQYPLCCHSFTLLGERTVLHSIAITVLQRNPGSAVHVGLNYHIQNQESHLAVEESNASGTSSPTSMDHAA